MRPSLVRLSALRLPSFRGGAFLSVACSKARAQRRVARTDLLYPPPRHDSGGGGPRSCAVEGASDSSLRFRRRRIVESDAPTAARTRGTSPVFTGEDEDGRLTRRFAFVAGESSSPTPLPPRFRLRAPRFGGLKPAVARRASEGGSRGTSPVFTGEDEDGRLRWRFVVVAERSLSPTLLPPPGACHRAGHFGPDPLARHLPRFHGGGLSVHARAYRPRLKKRSF